jgi:predicted 2-oxoglutarate/Fe(II)-dependent dioxygenase YbiX
VLKGTRIALVKRVQPVSIHGQISLDLFFVDPEEPDGAVSVARVGPESTPLHLEPGDLVELHYLLGAVTSVTRPAR